MNSILSRIPQELLDDIRRGECVPVIGAGFSMNAALPTGCTMPLWDELGRMIAAKSRVRPSGNALKDISAYCSRCTKFELIRLLRDCLHIRTAKPGRAHLGFARLPFEQVITTNFDFLLERAYEASGKCCIPVVDEDLLPFGLVDGETRLIKMHGDLHHPSLLIATEDDYDSFRDSRERMFQAIAHLLIQKTVLFIGYSIDDPDFRQIWRLVEKQFGQFRRPAYALLVEGSVEKIEEYTRRGVTRVISLPKGAVTHGATLEQAFHAIRRELNKPAVVHSSTKVRRIKSR